MLTSPSKQAPSSLGKVRMRGFSGLGRRGSVSLTVALTLGVLIGMAALGVEITYVLYKHRQMQAAVDAAAVAAASALTIGNASGMELEADAVASRSGFVPGVSGVTLTINNPPLSGPHAGDPTAVEAILGQPQTLDLVQLFRSGDFDVKVRAVAAKGVSGQYCLFGLDPTASGAVHLYNNAAVSNPDCGVITNSASDSGLMLDNNATISGPVRVHGDIWLANGAALTGKPIITKAPLVEDGYAGVAVQTPPACTSQSGSAGGTRTLTAGHFCSGWTFGNGANITLSPGVYYIDSRFALGNNVTIQGTGGVTLILNGSYALSYGNGLVMTLTAPTSGDYAGLVLFSPKTNSSFINQYFSNNSLLTFVGALYLPSQRLTFSNNVVVQSTTCTQIVARLITISNNVNLKNSCAGTGVVPVGASNSALVE